MKSVLVITATIGAPELKDCIESVLEQDYDNVSHMIVVDGAQYEEIVRGLVSSVNTATPPQIVVLPYNVGAGGWYSHRIISGFSHLINHDYVTFLDQDNMIETNHISSLVETLESGSHDWVYSLRKIYSKEGEYICDDDCESLGRWPVAADNRNGHLIDTNCYFYKTQFLRETGHLWDHGREADRRYYHIVTSMLKHDNFACSGESTLKYRLGGNETSVKKEFFMQLNDHVKSIYGSNPFPWRKPVKPE